MPHLIGLRSSRINFRIFPINRSLVKACTSITIEKRSWCLVDSNGVYTEWRRLVVRHKVSGVQVHDARLAASMYAHGLTHILTFNTADFARFDRIRPVHPSLLQPTALIS